MSAIFDFLAGGVFVLALHFVVRTLARAAHRRTHRRDATFTYGTSVPKEPWQADDDDTNEPVIEHEDGTTTPLDMTDMRDGLLVGGPFDCCTMKIPKQADQESCMMFAIFDEGMHMLHAYHGGHGTSIFDYQGSSTGPGVQPIQLGFDPARTSFPPLVFPPK